MDWALDAVAWSGLLQPAWGNGGVWKSKCSRFWLLSDKGATCIFPLASVRHNSWDSEAKSG